ncbi:MAG: hypothetical protein J6J36_06620 [Clostridia bacterium]|nr:hypothetical protein [Clostridia bacterium]
MKKQVYCIEVGVRLPPSHPEFECYKVEKMESDWGLYDENRAVEFTYDRALEYVKNYVKEGVDNTYGIVYEDILNLDDEDIKEIEQTGFCEFIDIPSKEMCLFYQVKMGQEIKTIIDEVGK